MSVSEKVGKFSDEQLSDWMRCNPGGAARAFEIWRKENPSVVSKEPRVVYREKPVERVVFKDKVIEKVVEKVVYCERKWGWKVWVVGVSGLSLLGAAVLGSFLPEPQIVERVIPGPVRLVEGPERVVTKVVREPVDDSYLRSEVKRLKEQNQRIITRWNMLPPSVTENVLRNE